LQKAVQGAYIEHIHLLQRAAATLGVQIDIRQVRKAEELQDLDGLILPGGESTTMAIVMERNGLWQPLKDWIHATTSPIWVKFFCRTQKS
jgi:5'-phosphate synthase pdxT subunit